MPLKSFRIGATIPGELKEPVQQRMESERYDSYSEYVLSLVHFDLYCHGTHHLFGPLMREPQRVKDDVVAHLAGDTGNPAAERGRQWIERRLAELAEWRKLNPLTDDCSPPIPQ